MVSFFSLSKILFFINLCGGFIIPPPLNNLYTPVKLRNNDLIKMNLFNKNITLNIVPFFDNLDNKSLKIYDAYKPAIDIVCITMYSYLLSHFMNIFYPQSFVYAYLLYTSTLFLISNLKEK